MYINIQGLNDNQLFWLTNLNTESDKVADKEVFTSLKHLIDKELVNRFVSRKTWLINLFLRFEEQATHTLVEGDKTKIIFVRNPTEKAKALLIKSPICAQQDSPLHLECSVQEFIKQDFIESEFEELDLEGCQSYPDIIKVLRWNTYSETLLRFDTYEYDAICCDQCYRLQGTSETIDYTQLKKALRQFETYKPNVDFIMFRDLFLYE